MNIQQIREQGIGNGFTVLNPHDGYRDNDAVWFGECDTCGERVTNSRYFKFSVDGVWLHKKMVGENRVMQIDYCPSVGENK